MANYDAISEETLASALRLVGEGQSLKKSCEAIGIDYWNAVRRINGSDELRQLYAQARRDYLNARVESLADLEANTAKEIKDLTDLRQASAMVQLARLKADNIKWEAERILRQTYGAKVEHSGTDGQPIQVAITSYSDTKEPQTPSK